MIRQYIDRYPVNYLDLLKDIRRKGDRSLRVVNQRVSSDRQNLIHRELSNEVVNELPSTAEPLVSTIKNFLARGTNPSHFNPIVDRKPTMNRTGKSGSELEPEPKGNPVLDSKSLGNKRRLFIVNEGLCQQKSERVWVGEMAKMSH